MHKKKKKIFKADFFYEVIGIFSVDSWTVLGRRNFRDYETTSLQLTGKD